jgi:hypothetical protein
MKMRILSFGKYYDVMDASSNVLCTIGLDAGQNVAGQMVGAAVSELAGDYLGRWAARRREYTYDVKDPQGNLALQIRKGVGGNAATFQVVELPAQNEVGRIELRRSLLGGLKASWVAPNGQVSDEGEHHRRKKDRRPGARGRSATRSCIRDVWQLELMPASNLPALFATVLDFRKRCRGRTGSRRDHRPRRFQQVLDPLDLVKIEWSSASFHHCVDVATVRSWPSVPQSPGDNGDGRW